jgi:hypothetical protein
MDIDFPFSSFEAKQLQTPTLTLLIDKVSPADQTQLCFQKGKQSTEDF